MSEGARDVDGKINFLCVITDDLIKQKNLKAGDIIIELGEYKVSSMDNYMQALNKFKKGDKTRVKFKRGNEILEASVEF